MKLEARVVGLHLRSVIGGDIRERWIFENPAVKKLHNVKRGSYDLSVLAETKRFGHWHVGIL